MLHHQKTPARELNDGSQRERKIAHLGGAAALITAALSLVALPSCERTEEVSAGDVARNPEKFEGKKVDVIGTIAGSPAIVTLSRDGQFATFAELTLVSDTGERLQTYLKLHNGKETELSDHYLLHARPAAYISPNGEVRATVGIDEGRAYMLHRPR